MIKEDKVYTDKIVCPYCGHEIEGIQEVWETFNKDIIFEGDENINFECPNCLKFFDFMIDSLKLGDGAANGDEDYGREILEIKIYVYAAEPILYLPMKKCWFDKIKSGEKTHEYREVKEHWRAMIYENEVQKVKRVQLRCGYSGPIMIFNIKNIHVVDGKNTDLHHDGPVYDIELGERIK